MADKSYAQLELEKIQALLDRCKNAEASPNGVSLHDALTDLVDAASELRVTVGVSDWLRDDDDTGRYLTREWVQRWGAARA